MLYPKEQLAPICLPEEELTRYYGDHTLAFLGLAPENLHFLSPGGDGLVNYRLESNVAVVLGDPICTPSAFECVTRSFLDFCADRNWRVAFYQVGQKHLAAYRALKLHLFKIGEEAIIDLQTFSLDGPAMAKIRFGYRHAEREGVTIHWYEGIPPTEVMYPLEQISNAWLVNKAGKHASERGFTMGRLDELAESAERADTVADIPISSNACSPRFLTAVATTSTGKACAFVTFTPIYGQKIINADGQSTLQNWGWNLDLMRRAPDAPRGVNELFIVCAIERFRACGAYIISLGLAAMTDTKQEITSGQRLLMNSAKNLGLFESGDALFNFKEKFHPNWESRYFITNTTLALPQVVLAVTRVRNSLGKKLGGI